jgi:uncharacterized protein YjbJ (UPF0337 family)
LARGEDEERLLEFWNSNDFWGGHKMRSSTKKEIAGKIHEVKGKIKEKVGQLTNDTDLQAKGIGEKIGGKIQKKIGQVEKAVGKP